MRIRRTVCMALVCVLMFGMSYTPANAEAIISNVPERFTTHQTKK